MTGRKKVQSIKPTLLFQYQTKLNCFLNKETFVRKYLLKSILFSLGLGFSLQAYSAVWTATNTWNESWEDQYSTWVKNEFNEDIFMNGRWKGLSTDCADAVYAARIIFASENSLPFQMLNPLGSGFITNEMTNWDKSKGDAKLRGFINYVSSIASTKSLPNDTYPVAIDRDYIKAGAVWSRPRITRENFFKKLLGLPTPEDPGHAEIVKEVSDSGVITLMGSTVPAAVRMLNITTSLVFMPIDQNTGFRRWKQPQDYNAPVSSLRGYSLDQFKIGTVENNFSNSGEGSSHTNTSGERRLNQWIQDTQNKLALRTESKDEKISRHVGDLCKLIQARVKIVQDGVKLKNQLGRCMDASEYDNYSTPSRDKRIMTTIDQLLESAGSNSIFGRSSTLKSLQPYLDQCAPLEIDEGQTVSMSQAVQAFVGKNASSDPNQSLLSRWGLEQTQNLGCQKY